MHADLIEALVVWGLQDAVEQPELTPPGSPERCAGRWVVRDGAGAEWLVERLRPDQEARRAAVAALVARLAARGLAQAVPCREPEGGGLVAHAAGSAWQVWPFVHGDALARPGYVLEAGRGEELARFLAALRRAAAPERGGELADGPDSESGVAPGDNPGPGGGTTDEPGVAPVFRLADYAPALARTAALRRPELADRLGAALERLHPFFRAEARLPHAVCHGDVHPLNVIWRGARVHAVIDWEFAGPKTALYDAANCLGCVGAEGPQALAQGLCPALAAGLRNAGGLDAEEAGWLVCAVAATRFGWLAEWLRRADEDMVRLELGYLEYLLDERAAIERVWLA
ncbi:MAG: phosphotransferase [Desulfovibrionaceae bacterium]|jgi:homoserine kinase type II|nr:phosphotransferase [Desulfovibrionaceae bacterium]